MRIVDSSGGDARVLGVVAYACGCHRQCAFWNAAEGRAVAEHSVAMLVERASIVGWRWGCIWECAWCAVVKTTAGGFGCMWRAGYTLVDLLGRGLRHGGDDWPSIGVCWAPRVAHDTERACDARLAGGQRPGDRASCLGEGTTGAPKCIEQCADVSDRACVCRCRAGVELVL